VQKVIIITNNLHLYRSNIHTVHIAESEARQLDRNMRDDVRSTGKRPRDAYTDMISSVPKKFEGAESQNNILVQLPSYHEVRTQQTRHRIHSCIPVPDHLSIPDILQKTLRAREAAEDDPLRNERFLLHTGQGGTYRNFWLTKNDTFEFTRFTVINAKRAANER